MQLKEVRENFPVLKRCLYLNCGTYGPLPTPVLDELERLLRLVQHGGPFNPEVDSYLQGIYEGAREKVASLIGARPHQVALTRNVSEGVNIVAHGLDWEPGDEVIIGDEEHPSGSLPWMNLARRRGVVVKTLHITPDTPRMLEELDSLITPRTRLVFLSHLSHVSGLVIPARQVVELAHGRGVPVMLDGAHTVGQMPVDVGEIGCDFYASCGHKWLFGPQGVGVLYVSEDWLPRLQVSWCGWGMTAEYDLERLHFTPLPDARRFEFGTRSWVLYGGLASACDFARRVGLEEIYARTRALASRAKAGLSSVRGVRLQTPPDGERTAGLVSLYTDGLRRDDVGEWLWREHRILVAHNPQRRWIRLSLAYFLLEEEVDRVVELLASLSP